MITIMKHIITGDVTCRYPMGEMTCTFTNPIRTADYRISPYTIAKYYVISNSYQDSSHTIATCWCECGKLCHQSVSAQAPSSPTGFLLSRPSLHFPLLPVLKPHSTSFVLLACFLLCRETHSSRTASFGASRLALW